MNSLRSFLYKKLRYFSILFFVGFFFLSSAVVAVAINCSDVQANCQTATGGISPDMQQCVAQYTATCTTGPGDPSTGRSGDPSTGSGGGITPTFPNPLAADSIDTLLEAVIRLMITVGVPVAVLFIIYAGFKFVTAAGDESQITKAKDMLKWTVIGVAVLLGASILAGVIKNTITSIGA